MHAALLHQAVMQAVMMAPPTGCAGAAALESRRAISNAYDAMTLQAYLRRSGCSASYTLQHSNTAIQELWTVA
jgi:hypothetical protein